MQRSLHSVEHGGRLNNIFDETIQKRMYKIIMSLLFSPKLRYIAIHRHFFVSEINAVVRK